MAGVDRLPLVRAVRATWLLTDQEGGWLVEALPQQPAMTATGSAATGAPRYP